MKKKVILPLLAVLTLGACAGTDGDSSMGSSSLGQSSSTSQSVSSSLESSGEESSLEDSSLEESSAEESSAEESSSEESVSSEEASSSQEEESSSQASDSSATSDTEPVSYKVVLPHEIDGIKIEASSLKPAANEKVRVFVKNTVQKSKRIDALTMNGQSLEGKYSNQPGVVVYEFFMPEGEDAQIEVEVVDVYEIKVDEEVSEYLTLNFETPEVAAEGEQVSFKVAAYSGFWFKYVEAVEDDVILTEEDGLYSFTMPAHQVTITAETGNSVYAVEAKNTDFYQFNGITDGQTFAVGEKVEFSVSKLGPDTVITKVFVDSTELEAEQNGNYSFVMPAYGVTLKAEYEIVARNVKAVSTDHFKLSLTTMVDDEEVEASNNVYANQKVYLNVEEVGEHNYIQTGFQFKGSNTSFEEATYSVSVTVKNEEDKQYFEMPSSCKYIVVSIAEEESAFKNSPLVGEYEGGITFTTSSYSSAYPSNETLTIDERGLTNKSATTKLVADPDDAHHYTFQSTYQNHYFFNNNYDLALYISGGYRDKYSTSANDIKLYSKGRGALDTSYKSKDNTQTFAYYTGSGLYSLTSLFTQVSFKKDVDGDSVITNASVFIDNISSSSVTIYWDVKAEVLLGNGYTRGDVVVIKQTDGTVLKTLKLTTIGENRYFMHGGEVAVAGEEAGTYTKADSDNLVLDGFGGGKLGESDITYTIKGNVVTVTKDTEQLKFTLDFDSNTYEEFVQTFSYVGKTYQGTFYDSEADEPISLSFTGEPSAEASTAKPNATLDLGSYGNKNVAYNIGDDNKITVKGDGTIVIAPQADGTLKIESVSGSLWDVSYYLEDVILVCPDLVYQKTFVSTDPSFDCKIEFTGESSETAGTLFNNSNCKITLPSNNERYGAWVMKDDGKITLKLSDGTLTLTLDQTGTKLTVESASGGNFFGYTSDFYDLVLEIEE